MMALNIRNTDFFSIACVDTTAIEEEKFYGLKMSGINRIDDSNYCRKKRILNIDQVFKENREKKYKNSLFCYQNLNDFFRYDDGKLYFKNIFDDSQVRSNELLFGRRYKCSVADIIFVMHHVWIPAAIEHIDGNQSNNKIENLRGLTEQDIVTANIEIEKQKRFEMVAKRQATILSKKNGTYIEKPKKVKPPRVEQEIERPLMVISHKEIAQINEYSKFAKIVEHQKIDDLVRFCRKSLEYFRNAMTAQYKTEITEHDYVDYLKGVGINKNFDHTDMVAICSFFESLILTNDHMKTKWYTNRQFDNSDMNVVFALKKINHIA